MAIEALKIQPIAAILKHNRMVIKAILLNEPNFKWLQTCKLDSDIAILSINVKFIRKENYETPQYSTIRQQYLYVLVLTGKIWDYNTKVAGLLLSIFFRRRSQRCCFHL